MTRTKHDIENRLDDLEQSDSSNEDKTMGEVLYEALGGDDAYYCVATHSYVPADSAVAAADRELRRKEQERLAAERDA